MGSYEKGKHEAVLWACQSFPKGSTCLDVGACDGIWHKMIGDHFVMDAIEPYEPNAKSLSGYRTVFIMKAIDCKYGWYDLIIFGDVIEHMTVEDAQKVLEYAYSRCKDMIIAVPFMYPQGALYGNPYERHIQSDLTLETFNERYKGFEVLQGFKDYAYFIKERCDDKGIDL